MKIKNRISIFTVTFLMVGLFFLVFTTMDASAGAAPPKVGCCTTEEGGGQCVGCAGDSSCLTSQNFCSSQDGFFDIGICFNTDDGAVCGAAKTTEGCCVIEPNHCVDAQSSEQCFGNNPDAEIWVNNESCVNVPQCNAARNVPTLSHWGLIALAGLFILVGIWAITRKKAEA